MNIKYISQFDDLQGRHEWRVEIVMLRPDDGTPSKIIKGFKFVPPCITVTYQETDKSAAIIGSTADLNLESPGDRTFIDLFTLGTEVLLTIYRDGKSYWQGTLDPEFYEEPYAEVKRYQVDFTFSDFGALKRLNFDMPALQRLSLDTLIRTAISKMGISSPGVDYRHSLIDPSTGAAVNMSDITVTCANFYDEGGESMTWYEVLEGVLKPLGLRICQTNGGHFEVYDLNALRGQITDIIEWSSDNQRLSTDKVYNKFTLTYSPYDNVSLQVNNKSADEYEIYNVKNGVRTKSPASLINNGTSEKLPGFYIQIGSEIDPGVNFYNALPDKGRYFKIQSVFSGSDCFGLAACARPLSMQRPGDTFPSFGNVDDIDARVTPAVPLICMNPVHVCGKKIESTPASNDARRRVNTWQGFALRLRLEILFDYRYNPFEYAGAENPVSSLNGLYIRHAYVPVRVYLKGDDGNIYYPGEERLYRLTDPDESSNTKLYYPSYNTRGWVKSADGSLPAFGHMHLSYYNIDDRTKPAFSGWKTNNITISPEIPDGGDRIPELWKKRGGGDYIELPPVSGELHVEIGSGVDLRGPHPGITNRDHTYPTTDVRWLLFKAPEVDIVKKTGQNINAEDVEYTAELLKGAAGETSIDTICGSEDGSLPVSRGAYYYKGKLLGNLTRGDLTDIPEKLLICQLASQYDARHIKLSGEVSNDGALVNKIFTDRAQEIGRLFMCTKSESNLYEGTCDATFVELSPQKYVAIK